MPHVRTMLSTPSAAGSAARSSRDAPPPHDGLDAVLVRLAWAVDARTIAPLLDLDPAALSPHAEAALEIEFTLSSVATPGARRYHAGLVCGEHRRTLLTLDAPALELARDAGGTGGMHLDLRAPSSGDHHERLLALSFDEHAVLRYARSSHFAALNIPGGRYDPPVLTLIPDARSA